MQLGQPLLEIADPLLELAHPVLGGPGAPPPALEARDLEAEPLVLLEELFGELLGLA